MLGAALDTAIGLVTIFLMLSLVCSAVNEAIASWFNRRGRFLRDGVATLFREPIGKQTGPNTTAFFKDRRIRALQREDRLPSYIAPDTFGAVTVALASGSVDATPGARLARIAHVTGAAGASVPPDGSAASTPLHGLLRDAVERAAQSPPRLLDEEPAAALARIESAMGKTFSETMDRVSGWYRRSTQTWLLGIAIVLVCLINADTLVIVRHLAVDDETRKALAEVGVAQATSPPITEGADGAGGAEQYANAARQILEQTRGIVLPLGWGLAEGGWNDLVGAWAWVGKSLGLLITAIALALGAPFWFDVLQKLASLRGAGGKPAAEGHAAPSGDGSSGGSTAPPASKDAGGGAAPGAPNAPAPTGGAPAITLTNAATASALPPGYWSELALAGPWSALVDGDPMTTLRLAQLSAIAYRSESVATRMLEGIGVKSIRWFDAEGTQGFAGTLHGDVIVAFRGTEPTEVQDLIADAQFAWQERDLGGGVTARMHGGFAGALERIRAKVEAAMGTAHAKDHRIWLTGHSLGAALASVLFGRLIATRSPFAASLRLVNFACPRVCDDAFRTLVERGLGGATAQCITLERDPVPLVPPMSMGYRHLGSIVTLSVGGVDSTGESWRALLDTLIDASTDLRRAASESLRRHGIEVYIAALEIAAESRRASTHTA